MSPDPASINRNCSTTPACWRTTPRFRRRPTFELSAPANLSAVFDHFVFDTTLPDDSLMMETAGAQCLVLAGFFEDQMRRRHNIRWYAELGASFFSRAASAGTVSAQGPTARRDRQALRGLAPAPRAAQPRSARPALSADSAEATGVRSPVTRVVSTRECRSPDTSEVYLAACPQPRRFPSPTELPHV